ncbi:hypothetical protein ACT691_01170 [Vibrio metschnikovii]
MLLSIACIMLFCLLISVDFAHVAVHNDIQAALPTFSLEGLSS